MVSERLRSNSSRETREEDPRDTVLLYSDIHKMPTRPSKSSKDLSLKAEKSLQERTKVIPPSPLMKRLMVRPEAKVHQSEEPRKQIELATNSSFLRIGEENIYYNGSF